MSPELDPIDEMLDELLEQKSKCVLDKNHSRALLRK